VALGLGLKATTRLPERSAAALFAFDILQLSYLLVLTGGVQNPFAALVLVPMALAAATLDLRSTTLVTCLALGCITVLALAAGPLPWRDGGLALPALYRVAGWAALSMTTVLMAVFAWSVAEEARQRSEALTATQLALAREQQLSALGGQAAAAAHLLGTPLATINIIAKEMVRELPDGSPLAEEAIELLAQAKRCRELLAGLGKRADGDDHRRFTRAPFTSLLEHIASEYARPGIEVRVRVEVSDEAVEPEVTLTAELRHSLANLIDNAIQFAAAEVTIDLRPSRSGVVLVIQDDGPGFPPEVLDWLGEPFLSTRREQGGLGLGIFIANTLLARTGARVHFDNTEKGARVTLSWPTQCLDRAFGEQTHDRRRD
jgi:two-component system sensor histidine kinase RegB